MSHLLAFVRFWYEFIVGDDWIVAVGVGCGVGATALIAAAAVPAWWVMPVCVLATLAGSLRRAVRRQK